jgi:acetolactate synthase-1/2/3 large subunit
MDGILDRVKMSGISELLEMWLGSTRPTILLGAGARKASAEIVQFAAKWNIPILTTWNAIDLIEWEHPLFIGRPGIVATRAANNTLQGCDLLLSIGARLDPNTIAFKYENLAPRAKKVLVDIDLSEALKISNLDLFVHMDSLKFIQELNKNEFISYKEWLEKCIYWKGIYGAEIDTTTVQLCRDLGRSLTSDDVLVLDTAGGAGGTIFPAFFKQPKGMRVLLSSCGLGSMGAGIPAAIAVSLASQKRVILIEGDGSFCQCMQELEVIHRLNLNIIIFIIENGGYASTRSSEMRAFGREGQGRSFPNIGKIALAFDICCCTYNPISMDYYLRQIEPMVVVVHAPYEELALPRVLFDGKGSLSNMSPYPSEEE